MSAKYRYTFSILAASLISLALIIPSGDASVHVSGNFTAWVVRVLSHRARLNVSINGYAHAN